METVLRSLYARVQLWYIKIEKATYGIYACNYLGSEKGRQKSKFHKEKRQKGNYSMFT